ncbi:AAA family ATPase [Mesorhizobium sp.]|uniref:AAA family ATPase n=1 Tax=Mesorhizobium sp. TaxID=1871066 RepID=UPI0025C1DB76|nr:AAA family ATPase [Mesorhizobium sp.]
MLLERQTQLRQLEALLADTMQGRGRVAALSGEAGAGKTALVEAFVDRMGVDRVGVDRPVQGVILLRSACEDLSIPDPLGPLYDLAREAQWELPRAIDDRQGQRLPLFSDALDVFEAKGPSLLIIEDLHWADDATLDFVRFLGRRFANSHILLLVTARTDRSEGQMRVRRALGEIPAGNVMRIEVPLLSEAAVSSLAEQAGRDGGAIYRASAGNAFFVTELLAAEGDTALPASVRDAVLARAERLSPGARSMLDAVSVFPRRADAWALSGLCGIAGCRPARRMRQPGPARGFRRRLRFPARDRAPRHRDGADAKQTARVQSARTGSAAGKFGCRHSEAGASCGRGAEPGGRARACAARRARSLARRCASRRRRPLRGRLAVLRWPADGKPGGAA